MIEDVPCLTFQISGNLRQVDGEWIVEVVGGGSFKMPFIGSLQSRLRTLVVHPFDLEGEPLEVRVAFPGRTGENTEFVSRTS